MKTIAALILGAALCTLPSFAQTGAQVAAAPVAQPERPTAFADRGDFTIEGFGGVNGSGTERSSVPTASASAGVQVGKGIGRGMAFTGTYLFDEVGKLGTVSVNAKEFDIGLLGAFRKRGRMEPYFRFDAGGYNQHWRFTGGKIADGATQFAVAPGAGFLLTINRFIALDFGVRAVFPVASDPLPWQIQGLVGVVFKMQHSR